MKELFSPCMLGGLHLRNRICRSATNDYAGNEDGTVSDAQMEIYRALAENEVGLILTGHACVCPDGRNDPRQNGMYDDRFLVSQRALTDMVHRLGGTIVQQLNHSGGKCPPAVIGGAPAAPSAMEYVPGVMARALEASEIQRIEDDFAAAAVRAKAAGYDGVQIHCAHGYLFSQFIDPSGTNGTTVTAAPPKTASALCAKLLKRCARRSGRTIRFCSSCTRTPRRPIRIFGPRS